MSPQNVNDSLDKEYLVYITDRDRFRVRVKTRPQERPTFSIQLECNFGGDDWYAVIRADDWHDRPHFDILSPDGSSQKKWQPDSGDNKINMKQCFNELKQIWELQRERYEHELNG